mmetsp:Transcript_17166/g.66829  ORF Transcript_17166/g.66829 Transcript_17166/m.66829 type:complete len:237 (-) Transcript_17166:87-797(-)
MRRIQLSTLRPGMPRMRSSFWGKARESWSCTRMTCGRTREFFSARMKSTLMMSGAPSATLPPTEMVDCSARRELCTRTASEKRTERVSSTTLGSVTPHWRSTWSRVAGRHSWSRSKGRRAGAMPHVQLAALGLPSPSRATTTRAKKASCESAALGSVSQGSSSSPVTFSWKESTCLTLTGAGPLCWGLMLRPRSVTSFCEGMVVRYSSRITESPSGHLTSFWRMPATMASWSVDLK